MFEIFGKALQQLILIVRYYMYTEAESPNGDTHYMLKWFDPGGNGRHQKYQYTMPTVLQPIGKWHYEEDVLLCDSGFHCSDMRYIHVWGNKHYHELYVVECGGKHHGSESKVAFSHIRVVRKINFNHDSSLSKQLALIMINNPIQISHCAEFINTYDEFSHIYSR